MKFLKLPFGNPHSNNQFGQESSMDVATSRPESGEKQVIYIVKVSAHKRLINYSSINKYKILINFTLEKPGSIILTKR